MILVDSRVGSRELLATIRQFGVDAELAGELDADFAFEGQGPDDTTLMVGVERKTVPDLLDSMRLGRLAGGQVGRMIDQFDVGYLIVEGIWRRQEGTGMLEIRNGGWRVPRGNHHYAEVDCFLCAVEELSGMRVWRTADERETCAAIADRAAWWSKRYEDHKTARTIYSPGPRLNRPGGRAVFRREATLLEKWIAALPGIGDRTTEIARYFGSPRDMADAEVERWLTIEEQRLGKITARKIVDAVTGR